MTDDDRLRALWALDDPPADDRVFVLSTLARLQRRQFRRDVARLATLAVAAAIVAWAVAPAAEALVPPGGGAALLAIVGGVLAAVLLIEDGRPEPV